jgi:hypothetical protein
VGAAVLLVALAGCSTGSGKSAASGDMAAKLSEPREGPQGQPVVAKDVALARSVIRTGSLTVTVRDVDAAARDVVAGAERAGGFLEGEESTLAAGTTLTVRVPPERFTATLDAVSRLGTVVERKVSTTDVTGDVADVDGRLAAATTSRDRLRDFLAKATTTGEVTELESDLATREGELESLQSRRRALSDQTSYASVTATLRRTAPPPPARAATGFRAGLRHGWDVFTATVAVLLVVLGAVAPFAVVVALVGVPLLLRRRRTTTPA